MPSARSSDSAPVEIASTGTVALSPSFITEPCPNCFSIWLTAAVSAASLAWASFSAAFRSAFFASAIFVITFLHGQQIQLRKSDVLGPFALQKGPVEGDPGGAEW